MIAAIIRVPPREAVLELEFQAERIGEVSDQTRDGSSIQCRSANANDVTEASGTGSIFQTHKVTAFQGLTGHSRAWTDGTTVTVTRRGR